MYKDQSPRKLTQIGLVSFVSSQSQYFSVVVFFFPCSEIVQYTFIRTQRTLYTTSSKISLSHDHHKSLNKIKQHEHIFKRGRPPS